MSTVPAAAPAAASRRTPWLRRIGIGAIALIVLIQLVPVWLFQNNPPIVAQPTWTNAEAEAIARKACYDCHSNETVWPYYSKIAPVSWLVTLDVFRGRRKLNFSEWGRGRSVNEMTRVVRNGSMPMGIYTIMHPTAKLTEAERQILIDGLKTLGTPTPGPTSKALEPKTITSEVAATAARLYRGSGEVTQVELTRKDERIFFSVHFADGAEVFVDGLTGQVAYARLESKPPRN